MLLLLLLFAAIVVVVVAVVVSVACVVIWIIVIRIMSQFVLHPYRLNRGAKIKPHFYRGFQGFRFMATQTEDLESLVNASDLHERLRSPNAGRHLPEVVFATPKDREAAPRPKPKKKNLKLRVHGC